MQIRSVVQLDSQQKQLINELMRQIQKHDHTFREPYLSNQFNYFQDMPTFILGYAEKQLIAFGMLYADEAPDGGVDVFIEVHPDFRRNGFGKSIRQMAQKILQKYGYQQVTYVSEKNFLSANPDFLKQEKLIVKDTEYQMRLVARPVQPNLGDKIIRLMITQDIDQLIQPYCEAFAGETEIGARQYLTESLQDSATLTFVLEQKNSLLGYCAIDVSDKYYLFGVFIRSDYRQQGLGRILLGQVINLLLQRELKPFIIGVESENTIAHHLYETLGFKDETKICNLVQAGGTDIK